MEPQNKEGLNTQQFSAQQVSNLNQAAGTTSSAPESADISNNSTVNNVPIKTNKNTKLIVLAIVFILSIGTLFSSVSTILKDNKAKNWPNVSGVIVKADRTGNYSRGNISYTYTAEYIVRDKKYTQRFRSKNSSLETNSNVTVAYNASNPNDAVISGEPGTTFYNYILLFAGIILAPLSVFGIFKTLKK